MSPCASPRVVFRSALFALVLGLAFASTSRATTTAGRSDAPSTYDFSETEWVFHKARVRLQFRVPGLGRLRSKQRPAAKLDVGASTWTLRMGGQTFSSGTTQHAEPSKRLLDLTLVDETALRAWLLSQVLEFAADHELQIDTFDVSVDVAQSRLKASHAKAKQTSVGRLRVRLKLSGTLEGTLAGTPSGSIPWSAIVRCSASSKPQPADAILHDPDPTPPEADFWMSGFIGEAPFLVHFDDRSAGTVNTRTWSFGDGALSHLTSPAYIYETPGSYLVDLEVVGPLGSDLHTRTITVIDPYQPPIDLPMTLYPASPTGPQVGTLTKQLGPDSAFYVGMTPGFAVQFSITLDGPTNKSRKFGTSMRVSSDRPQQLRSSLVLRRFAGGETVIFEEQTLTVPGTGIITQFARNKVGDPIQAKAGDRLQWTIWNDTPLGSPTADLRIVLDQSRVTFPRF
jgi:hypothetical protein